MKQFFRFIWLVFYIPVFILECIILFFTFITYPFVGAFYFVKTGDVENTPYEPITPMLYIDKMYKKLLTKIENKKENKP